MPITSLRAIPVERGPEGRVAGREAPEATGRSANALDVISSFRFPMAPSSKTNHRRINSQWQRRYPRVTEECADRFHQSTMAVDIRWTTLARGIAPRRTGGATRGPGRHAPRRRDRAALPADGEHLDSRPVGGGFGAELGVAIGAHPPDRADRRRETGVRDAVAQRPPQVRPVEGEQAGVELALGRQARPRARTAERLADRSDHAHFAVTVAIAPAIGDLAGIVGREGLEAELGVDQSDDLRGRHDLVESPAIRVAHVHVLDEPEDVTLAAGPAGHRQDAGVVGAGPPPHIVL